MLSDKLNKILLDFNLKIGFSLLLKKLYNENIDTMFLNAVKENEPNQVEWCLNNGANVHIEDDLALQYASGNGFTKIVKLLLDNGANSDAMNGCAVTWAYENGHAEVINLLRKKMQDEPQE